MAQLNSRGTNQCFPLSHSPSMHITLAHSLQIHTPLNSNSWTQKENTKLYHHQPSKALSSVLRLHPFVIDEGEVVCLPHEPR